MPTTMHLHVSQESFFPLHYGSYTYSHSTPQGAAFHKNVLEHVTKYH